ncbi:MAG: prolyl oligopeptidase family serine peptidase [Acidobacteriota bacterium]|nr:prolyl oligopeptidase family serine peptidase [Acidobacteriota bacterium]
MKGLYCALLLALCATFAFSQEAETAPGDNLVVEGIPRIPASLAEEVSHYTRGRNAGLLSWHPMRREMLIATRFADTAQVHQVSFPGGARTQQTFLSDIVTTGVSYQPRIGGYFIFNKDVGGNGNFQIYRSDFATGAVTLLTDGQSRNSPGVWSRAGDRIIYSSTRRNGRDADLYVINPSEPGSNRLLAQVEGGGWGALDWSPDDRKILVLEVVSINERYLWLVDVATGERTPLTPKGDDQKVYYDGGRFSGDGRGIYVTTDRDSDFRRLTYIELATGRHTYLTSHINWDIEEFRLSPNGRMLAIVVNENGILSLRLIDAVTRREMRRPELPPGYVTGIRWHDNGRELGFNLDSARSPTDVYSLDVTTGRVERWTYSETGGLNAQNFVEPELIRWRSFDGREISGFLYRPPARFTGRRPVIMDIHGGPEAQFQPYYLGRRNYYLNELGIALIFPNIRGSSGFGKSFLRLDNGFLRENSYRDIGSLLDWIRTRPELDAERIMVTGISYGGHVSLAVASLYADRIRCAIDIVGPSNLVTFLENTAGYRQNLRRVEYGDEREPRMRAYLEQIAPLNNASRITKPLFIIQGANDPSVPLSESERMAAAVRRSGAPIWYLMARDEGHGFIKKPNADFQFYATVLFIREHLLR